MPWRLVREWVLPSDASERVTASKPRPASGGGQAGRRRRRQRRRWWTGAWDGGGGLHFDKVHDLARELLHLA